MGETSRANQYVLLSTVNTIDNIAKDMVSNVEFIVKNQQYKDFVGLESGRTNYLFLIPSVLNVLKTQHVSSSDIDILIYISEIDFIIARSTANSAYNIYNVLKYANKANISFEEYYSQFKNYYFDYEWFISDLYSYSNAGVDSLTLSRSFLASTYPADSKYNTTFYVTIPLSSFAKLLDVRTQENTLLIYNKENQLVYSEQDFEHPLNIDVDDILRGDNALKIGERPYIAVGAKSNICGLTFVLLTPAVNYWNKVYYWTADTIMFIIGALIIGIALVMIMIRYNYNPLYKILNSFGINTEQACDINEFDLIEDSYLKIYTDYKETTFLLNKQRDFVEKNYVLSHIQGNRHNFSDEDLHEYLGLDLSSKSYIFLNFMVAYNDIYDELEKNIEQIQTYIYNKLNNDSISLYKFKYDQNMIYLIVIDTDKAENFYNTLNSRINRILTGAKRLFSITASAVIGNFSSDFNELHRRYQELLNAIEHQCISGIIGITYTSEIKMHSVTDKWIQEDIEIVCLLCDAIKAKGYTDAELIVERLFERLPSPDNSSFLNQYFRILSWINIMINVLPKEICEGDKLTFTRKLISKIAKSDNIFSIKSGIFELVHLLCNDGISGEDNYKQPRLSVRVERYVEKHFKDSNLCIATIAEEMSLSPNYLSQIFRSETGMGLLDYINGVRITYAKQLLNSNKYTIGEISIKSGYNHVKTFRRAFQKIEGVNPSRFLEQ